MITAEMKNSHVLLVDDEQSELDAYSLLLSSMGVKNVVTLSDSSVVSETLDSMQASIVFLDLNMPKVSGMDVLKELRANKPHIPVVIITANSEIETAVECLKLGAHDYLVKPIDLKTFSSALRNALEIGLLRNEVLSLKGIHFDRLPKTNKAFEPIITCSAGMQSIFNYIDAIATSGMPTLILGETGSGKELLAKAIHELSNLPGEFVAVDASGLDDNLFSDTLFGHKKGAYTGADHQRPGMIEKAKNGTLFLDEIGDLAEASQVKLLRLLQENIYYPLGTDQPHQCNARIITAANKDLTKLAGQEGEFRMDLYYRLSTHLIKVPPLRERREDIPMLVTHLLQQAASAMNKKVPSVSDTVVDTLCRHPFFGNVRELKAYIFDAVALCEFDRIEDEVILERLADAVTIRKNDQSPNYSNPLESIFGYFPTLTELNDYAVALALASADNNQSQAARLLGISRQALHKRIKKNTS
ncbi:sigma-54-dependent transcriptional regulator [Desulfogranum marinum]|jgi:DNA-binding NtrC family response regulator|uniref:sigma-54-dependent transcriptional regulator n=1 Tax=Desulfogranum marinum TaxID=453220 RepID=UPI001964DA0E|nr:sigma-54 dependent transcriptional regulator [Desulfogranum marinum]MBM9514989.1 sigma-54-dependent Fis family transcriptional regulator [Desulfogranum marinum]